jgi:hypothetical protein
MTKYLILTTLSVLIVAALLLGLCSQITFHSKAYAQLPLPNVNSNTSRIITSAAATSNNNAIITIHTTNSIQGNSINVIKQEEPVIRKAILSNIDNAIVIAKGSVRSAIPINVNAKIINQLANNRIDTTQGIDMTKRLIATELTNAINTTATNSNASSQLLHQPTKIAFDNQANCTDISSTTKAVCTFLVSIHN